MRQTIIFNSEREAKQYLAQREDADRHHSENMRRAGANVHYDSGGYELKPVHGDMYKWELTIW